MFDQLIFQFSSVEISNRTTDEPIETDVSVEAGGSTGQNPGVSERGESAVIRPVAVIGVVESDRRHEQHDTNVDLIKKKYIFQ